MTAVHCSLRPWLWWRSLACTWRLEAEVTCTEERVRLMVMSRSSQGHQLGAGVRRLPSPDGAKQEPSLQRARSSLRPRPGVQETLVTPGVDAGLVINL